jgi:hypothetical protein
VISRMNLGPRASYVGQAARKYPWVVALSSLVFIALYLWFDFREGGINSNLGTTRMATAPEYIKFFGAPWFYGMVVADVVLAVLTSLSLVVAIASFVRRRSGAASCSVGASAVVAFATFGCPGCPVPLAGSLGVTLFANTLPLFGFEFKILTLLVLLGSLYWQTSPSRISASGGSAASNVGPPVVESEA